MDYRNWKITHQRIKSFKFSKWRPNYREIFLGTKTKPKTSILYLSSPHHVQGLTTLKIKARIEFLLLFDVIKKKKKSKLICHNTHNTYIYIYTHIVRETQHTDTSSDRISFQFSSGPMHLFWAAQKPQLSLFFSFSESRLSGFHCILNCITVLHFTTLKLVNFLTKMSTNNATLGVL